MNEVSCLFCSIIERKIPAQIIAENARVLAFQDINPQAPSHVLIVPKLHFACINDISPENAHYLSDMMLLAKKIAQQLGVDDSGYRLVINNGPDAQQSVAHIHAHLLGGRHFSWPPG